MLSVSNSESKKTYTVNTEVEICECPVGRTGAPCKHQYFVVKKYNLSSNQFFPFTDVKTKKLLYQIVNGSTEGLPAEWFSSLKSGPVDPFAASPSLSEEGLSGNVESDGVEGSAGPNELSVPNNDIVAVSEDVNPDSNDTRLDTCLASLDAMLSDVRSRLISSFQL